MLKFLKVAFYTALLIFSTTSFSQSNKYPDKPIELVVLFPVGS